MWVLKIFLVIQSLEVVLGQPAFTWSKLTIEEPEKCEWSLFKVIN